MKTFYMKTREQSCFNRDGKVRKGCWCLHTLVWWCEYWKWIWMFDQLQFYDLGKFALQLILLASHFSPLIWSVMSLFSSWIMWDTQTFGTPATAMKGQCVCSLFNLQSHVSYELWVLDHMSRAVPGYTFIVTEMLANKAGVPNNWDIMTCTQH